MNTCPCNTCPCVPICRLKQYQMLINECSLVWNYLKIPYHFYLIDGEERSNGSLQIIKKALDPTMWTLFYDEFGRAMVDSYTGYAKCHFHY